MVRPATHPQARPASPLGSHHSGLDVFRCSDPRTGALANGAFFTFICILGLVLDISQMIGSFGILQGIEWLPNQEPDSVVMLYLVRTRTRFSG